MGKKGLMLLLLLALANSAMGQIVVGDIRTDPGVIVVSTENITLRWATSDLATSSVSCTGPGLYIPSTAAATEPTTVHEFSMEANFTDEGTLQCNVLVSPVNGTMVSKDFNTSVNCEGVRLELLEPSIRTAAYFTRPRGSGPYTINTTVKVKNGCVGRAVPTASTSAPAGMRMSVETDTVYGLDSRNFPISLTVPDSTPEGDYRGSIGFSANGSSITLAVNISVHWPSPRLEATLGQIGNVKSGANMTKSFEIVETMGYKSAEDVSCRVEFQDKRQTPQTMALGDIGPFGNRTCTFSMGFPARNVVIGDYAVRVRVNSSNSEYREFSSIYTIPAPVIGFSPGSMDLGKLTFEEGKDVSTAVLTVLEKGGFTPIEGMEFRLVSGESGWVSLPFCDYVPPGGSADCDFRVSLNENATIGVREWEFEVSSRYTETALLGARVEVYFIGIDDAVRELGDMENYTVVGMFPEARELKSSAIRMLEDIREGEIGIANTASVISVHGGVTSLLGQMEEARRRFSSGDYLEGGRDLLAARMALERISSSYRSSAGNDTKILNDLGAVYAASASFWSASSKDLLGRLEQEASSSERISYRRAAEYYSLLADIYSESEGEKSAEFSRKALAMEKSYADSVARAGEIRRNADRLISLARENTVQVGGIRLVLNPLSYKPAVENYGLALADYEAAAQLYKSAGQQNDVNGVLATLGKGEREYELADRVFVLGSVGLSLFFILLLLRVTVGMQQYRDDEDDSELGGVMVR